MVTPQRHHEDVQLREPGEERSLGAVFGCEQRDRNVGGGGLVRTTQAKVDLDIDGRTIQVDAGGTQVGVGVRFAF